MTDEQKANLEQLRDLVSQLGYVYPPKGEVMGLRLALELLTSCADRIAELERRMDEWEGGK